MALVFKYNQNVIISKNFIEIIHLHISKNLVHLVFLPNYYYFLLF